MSALGQVGRMPHAPVLDCEASLRFEEALLGDDVDHTWEAMNRAGRLLGRSILRDFQELGTFPDDARILVLAGKGHNAGDAILAADEILRHCPLAKIDLVLAYGEEALRPLPARALSDIREIGLVRDREPERLMAESDWRWDVCIDGLFGMQFRPPLRAPAEALIEWVNQQSIRFRAAVDLPSGLGEDSAQTCFRADFTYATGIAKSPLFEEAHAGWVGRIRFLDIGLFNAPSAPALEVDTPQILSARVLDDLQRLRPSAVNKRDYGHLYVLAGSRGMPGALLMSVQAALRSGVGLVTAFAPESQVATLAAQTPEAMWKAWPETPEGGLALEGIQLLRRECPRMDALLLGPGLGRGEETQALLGDLFDFVETPVMLDADALQPDVLAAASRRKSQAPLLLTPHLGEFRRLCDEEDLSPEGLRHWAAQAGAHLLLKGAVTQITDGRTLYYSTAGGPVLARGGSGDILAGLLGGLLASRPEEPLQALLQAAQWHGLAADALARRCGQVATTVTGLLPELATVLRHE